MNKINLAVIFGGQSGEHEVSLSSVRGVLDVLDKNKYNILPIAITKNGQWLSGSKAGEYLESKKINASEKNFDELNSLAVCDSKNFDDCLQGCRNTGKIDLVFPIIHGTFGEDGRLQGLLDMLGIPYVFSGALASALAMNKPKCKIIASHYDVPVLADKIYTKDGIDIPKILEKFGLPVVIKPTELGSSVGIAIAKTEEELEQGLEDAFGMTNEVMLEKYAKGREFTVTVMGKENPQVLAVTEIIPLISDFYDYKAKYENGGSKHICPAEIPTDIEERLRKKAIKIYEAVGCKDLARADFIWDEVKNQIYFIELNTIPGMTPTSLAPEAAKYAGMEFGNFLDKLINFNL